jgi:hypothetical protein
VDTGGDGFMHVGDFVQRWCARNVRGMVLLPTHGCRLLQSLRLWHVSPATGHSSHHDLDRTPFALLVADKTFTTSDDGMFGANEWSQPRVGCLPRDCRARCV